MSEDKYSPYISLGSRVRKSPYFESTKQAGAKAFSIYNHMYMPTLYTSVVDEYWSMVNDVVMIDVGVERQIEISGPDAHKLIQFITPRDVSNCDLGKCYYILLTGEDGGIINDAVLLRLNDEQFWVSPGDGDVLLWIEGVAVNSGMDVNVFEPDVSPLQMGGPKSPHVMYELFGDLAIDLGYYRAAQTEVNGIPLVLGRTGWSGELSYELYLQDGSRGNELWGLVAKAGEKYNIKPAAPQLIRSIEGELLSYASDISRTDNPYTIDMGRMVNLEREDDFIGKAALQKIHAEGVKRKLVGVEIAGDPINAPPEHLWAIKDGHNSIGHITRCIYSPRLKKNIGFANVPIEYTEIGSKLSIDSPRGLLSASICKKPWFPAEIKIPKDDFI
ncbi:MAG: glycine cleavage T C-terminal barrel domain-containing protein [Woeseiaceae bacterium]|nr:glycine cleavage T C-terminal barrel domain-containing protein [Woeseiaceae bacterium]MDG1865868.1 glycine cleavage T C-terminal barrel domain-containing protein [Woeseiaceae bacterium]